MRDASGRFVDVPGGFLHCRTHGQGPDVVLCNPGGADLRVWESTLSWLAEIARVTTFDYRDTGLSSPGTEPYSEIDDIAAVMDAAGVVSAVLVGVSDGARRALGFGQRYPDRVRRIVASGGTFGDFPDPSPAEAAARREMRDHFARRAQARASGGAYAEAALDLDTWAPALDPYQRRRMIGLTVANDYLVTLADDDYFGRELEPPVKTRFREITVPVSVLVGEHDLANTRLWAQRVADEVPDATLTVLAGADHFPMLSTPDQFERFLRDTLA
jgi:pimeloyl-ACP methyl ester carboxylesterase